MKNLTSKYMIYLVLGMITIVLAIGGVTYAYFMKESTQTDENVISTLSCIDIAFVSDTASINLGSAYPMTNEEGKNMAPYNFTLTNTCSGYIEYTLVASVMNTGKNVPDNYIKLSLNGDAIINPITVNNLEQIDTPSALSSFDILKSYKLTDGSINNKSNSSYSFRMWLDGDNQAVWNDNTLSGKNYAIKLTVVGVAKKSTFASIIRDANPLKTGADFNVAADSTNTATQSGLFSAPDDYGTSYYFRGVVNNNNVIFGGYQWKIIRIDGRGNIKLIYNGTEAQFNTSGTVNTTGANTQLPNTKFNELSNDNKYVGYVVDGGSSTIKSAVDAFYAGLSTEAKGKIVESIYCNDLTYVSGTGTGTSNTNYVSYDRLSTKKTPSFMCPESAGKLTLPIGLITADEVACAGGTTEEPNNAYYLYNASNYWTMSPNIFMFGEALEWYVHSLGVLISNNVASSGNGSRPIITLSSEIRVTGTGTATDPYKAS